MRHLRTVWLVTAFFLLFSGSAFAAAESIRQIHRALQAGEIDYRAALNYKVYAVFKSHKLPRGFRSAGPPIKSATPVVHEAKRNAHLLSDDNLFILRRPTDATDPDYYGTGVPVLIYDSPAGHFKIHYTENNTNGDAVYGSDGNPSTIPAMVVDLATYLDSAWNQVINSMGYLQTPGDGTAGGDGKLDVYLKRIDAYGYTAWDTSPADVYIVLNNDYSVGFPQNFDPDGSMQGALKVAAAHEFFHTSQFQYTALQENLWWMEATATWMEDQLYPMVKDYFYQVGYKYDDANDNGAWDTGETWYRVDGVSVAGTSGRPSKWFDQPHYSLDSTSGNHEYGTVVWAKYLSEQYGAAIIRSVLERIGSQPDSTALQALSDLFVSTGSSLPAQFIAFESTNYRRAYVDGGYYPLVRHDAMHISSPVGTSATLDHLSARFYGIKASGSSTMLALTFTNMNSGNLAARVILTRVAGGYDEQDITLDASPVTTAISGFGTSATYVRAVVVVMNTSTSEDGISITMASSNSDSGLSVSFNGPAPVSPTPLPQDSSSSEGGGGGGGCFIATAAYGSYLAPEVLLLREFRDRHLMGNRLGAALVRYYYSVSPPLAGYIAKSESARAITRVVLTPVIYGVKYPGTAWVLFSAVIIGRLVLPRVRRVRAHRSKRQCDAFTSSFR
jgi:hypothetical protein